jgi:hypothetical protein
MNKIILTATKTGAQNSKNALSCINVQTGKVFVGSASYEDSIADDSANLTVGVFFDGTLNSRENTQARIAYEKATANNYVLQPMPLGILKQNHLRHLRCLRLQKTTKLY